VRAQASKQATANVLDHFAPNRAGSDLCVRSARDSFAAVVRAAGLEPAQALRPYGFSYQLRLSPFHIRDVATVSLWSGLSLHRGVRPVRRPL
jgi:hypothetical protein